MIYVLDVAGFRNYLLVPGLPIGLQRSGKNYPTSPLVSSGRGQAQGFPSCTLVNNFQLNSEPAPDLENRRRGPQVAVTVTSNECLTRGPRPAPSDASRRKATQGVLANPCSGGNSEPRYLPGYRTPYRYVSSAAFNTAG